MAYMLAVDSGLTMCKAVVFSLDGEEVGSGSSRPPTLYPRAGWAERDPEALWSHVVRAIREAVTRAGLEAEEIGCVTLTGHGNGLYCLDGDFLPTRSGILSVDTRASATVERLREEDTPARVHAVTGNQVWAGSPPVLLRWIKDNETEVYRRTRHICLVKDYIRYRLTGELNTDHTDATGGALADTSKGAYAREIYEAYGIPEAWGMLPPILDSWALGGRVTRECSAETGLAPGTPVAVGGMDLDMTALGCGCIRPGQMSIIVGTWSINSLIMDRPALVPDILFTSTYSVPGLWLLMDGSATSATNLDWFVEQLCFWEKKEGETRGVSPFQIVDEEVREMTPSSCEIIFHPFIYGSNVQPSARAGFYGLGGWHRREDMLRAVLEGVCFSHLSHVERLRFVRQEDEAFIAGGGKRSDVWTQIFADVLGTPIRVPRADELGALGCAITGAVASGCYPDHETAV
ncbi:MAG: carbohydrate kinase, partial [Deltaproteobacteria bacterium]|nr:carbohydrate kinase [Deltaproteobacteria bacterium]